MGGGSSKTRKLSLENDDPTSVIRVSEDVVDRIRGGQLVRPPQYSQNPSWQGNFPQAAAAPFNLYEPSLTTIQLRQENIENLQKNDEYWEKRLKGLEETHQKINKVLEEEYQKAVNELGGTTSAQQILSELPCADKKNEVVKCYKENAREPMVCSDIVKEFQQCVDKKRICMVAKLKG